MIISYDSDRYGWIYATTYLHTAIPPVISRCACADSGEFVMTADSCYMRKVLEEMVLPPFAFSYDAMREVIERYVK
jgi:hypothetical protein